jgi:hypothetical protein
MNTRIHRIKGRKAFVLAGAVVVAASMSQPGPAAAYVSSGDLFRGMTPLSSADLAGYRGGFSVGGFDFDIGMIVNMMVQKATGKYHVRTVFNFNHAGRIENPSSQVTYTPHGSSSPQPVSTNGGGGPSGGSAPTPTSVAPKSSGSSGGGVSIDVTDAGTRIVQQITPKMVLNMVQSSDPSTHSQVSADLNIAIKNWSQIRNRVNKALPALRNLTRDANLSGLR